MIEIHADAAKKVQSYFEGELTEVATNAMRLAINTVAERSGMKLLRDAIESQVDFPRGYLDNRRLQLRKKAYNRDLEAIIAARQRPTSLARFVQGHPPVTGNRRGGVSVRVKPGSTKRMPSAFLMRLRAGAVLSDENFNVGLAIRLKPGDRVLNKKKQSAVQLSHNLYLLYGPSVDQVFRSVAEEESEVIAQKVEDEFLRQFVRLGNAR